MTDMLEALASNARDALGDAVTGATIANGELTLEIRREDLAKACRLLRDNTQFSFEQLIDLCGMDYLAYGSESLQGERQGRRFAAVYHLLSVRNNRRLRLRTFLADDLPRVDSVVDIWSAANWFEREAFDLFGIVFEGHPDLRRILTDYGFVGHPFRKDFPLIGQVEMRYDPQKQRVVYEPVRTELRINVPRVIRDEGFARG